MAIEVYSDNQNVIYMSNNPMFYWETKHVEIYCNFIREFLIKEDIYTPYVKLHDMLGDIFTKISTKTYFSFCTKLGILNIYAREI